MEGRFRSTNLIFSNISEKSTRIIQDISMSSNSKMISSMKVLMESICAWFWISWARRSGTCCSNVLKSSFPRPSEDSLRHKSCKFLIGYTNLAGSSIQACRDLSQLQEDLPLTVSTDIKPDCILIEIPDVNTVVQNYLDNKREHDLAEPLSALISRPILNSVDIDYSQIRFRLTDFGVGM